MWSYSVVNLSKIGQSGVELLII